MVARWLSLLDTYDFKIEHRKGTLHGNADALSRRPRRRCKRDECLQCQNGSECEVNVNAITRSHLTQSDASTSKTVTSPESNLNDRSKDYKGDNRLQTRATNSNWLGQWSSDELVTEQKNDAAIRHITQLLETHTQKPEVKSTNQEFKLLMRQWQSLKVSNGLLYRIYENEDTGPHFQLVTPHAMRREIMHQLHNVRTAGHLGREKTLNRIKARFYWPGMTDDVSRWCQSCMSCQKRKPGPGLGKSPMQHCTVYGPMECIAIDILGPLPTTDDGNWYIMVVGDYFSKWSETYALRQHTAQTVADKLVTEFICRFSTPTRIHTDQGPEFESHLFARMCKLLDIEKSRTTPYHPQSDGMVERYNRTLAMMLAMFVSENKDDWDDHLPYLCMAYRAYIHDSTKCSPNLLMLGREISLPIDVMTGNSICTPELNCPNIYIEWVRESMQRSFDFAHGNLQSSFCRQKRYYDTKLKSRDYKVDSLVFRWYPPEANQKLGLGWIGPYKVIRKISDITYEIERCADNKRKIVHVDHLKPVVLQTELNEIDAQEMNITGLYESTDDTELSNHKIDDADDHSYQKGIETVEMNSPKFSRTGSLIKPPVLFSPY
ncbi:unnamed protein product [Mytilus coruscus]|uniref:Integrase catalytic domain-containing protein n=1 Tax=Mytilus coruscus TaxID=42192 RepID=A0A6J8B4P0_MYTCO|nr:unnamed protein product [Mytilus coruscus]